MAIVSNGSVSGRKQFSKDIFPVISHTGKLLAFPGTVQSKKGQAVALSFMLAVVVLLLALAFAYPVNQLTTMAMNSTSDIGGMDCSNVSIDDYTQAACWTMDIGQAYVIGGFIAIAGLIIGAKLLFSE